MPKYEKSPALRGVILLSEWWSRAAATRHGVGLPKTETTRTGKK